MKCRLFASLTLVVLSMLFVGCTSDNAMQEASQVSNLQEVDFSVFEKTQEDLPTRADDASSVPLSETNLFTELEVALIPVDQPNTVKDSVRQLSTDEKFGEAKMYVPKGEYYLVAVAAKTKKPGNGHQITIKSNTEIDFPDNIVTDMAYYYEKVTIGDQKKSLSVPLKRAVSAFYVISADQCVANAKSFEVSITKGVGSVFNPFTGFCTKEETYTRQFDISDKKGKILAFTIYVLLPEKERKDVSITLKSIDTNGNLLKTTTFNDVHLVYGKRTNYKGPLFNNTVSTSFTFSEGEIDNAEDVTHEFD